MAKVNVEDMDNGFLFRREAEEGDGSLGFSKVIVVEGKDERKLGETLLSLFKKPRKSPVRKGAAA